MFVGRERAHCTFTLMQGKIIEAIDAKKSKANDLIEQARR